MTTYTLGFSPCPNDTFIFNALVNGAIHTQDIGFEVVLEEVQTLNEWALQEKLSFSKISYGVYPLVHFNYTLLQSGGALGKGVGPLLISKNPLTLSNINNYTIAIPGKNTTAHLLFSWAFPNATQKKFMVFHEIENAVLNGEVDAGVIIHENRFTYQQKGLLSLADLGKLWEEQLQLPIPLGGIVAHKKIPIQHIRLVDNWIQESIAIAWNSYPFLHDYIKLHAQEMSEEVMRKHIELYVNDFSKALGADGFKAINTLVTVFNQLQNNNS